MLETDPGNWRAPSITVAREALRRRLPARYDHAPRHLFDAHARPLLRPGSTVLDVGGGRCPTFSPADRPGCTYIGLDLCQAELDAAPAGSYERTVASNVTDLVPELAETFDAIVSWQVLEHVKPLPSAMENLRQYLRPGGQLVAHFSGTFGLFALLSRVVPDRVTPALLERMFSRPRFTTFPAYYDRCWASALADVGRSWSSFEVVPRHEGARYFAFSRHVQAAYLAYEEWACQKGLSNLASYYLVLATR